MLCLLIGLWFAGLGGAWAYDLKDNAVLHAQNGQLLMERQQYSQAIEEFQAALKLNPYTNLSASLHNNLGLAYRAMGQPSWALLEFQQACRLQPTFALYFKNMIETYANVGKLPLLERHLRQMVTENPTNAEAWFLLGLLYQEQGNRSAAQQSFARFLKLQPESDLARAAKTAL